MITGKDQLLVIVNPASRDGSLRKEWPLIAQALQSKGLEYELIFTEHAGHASEIAHGVTQRSLPPKLVVAVGGDGTVNEVARGLRGSTIVLGLIPYGSGNDYARAHGIDRDYRKSIEILINGVDRAVGAIRIEAKPAPELKGIPSPKPTPWDGPSTKEGMVTRWAFEECDIGVTATVGRRKCEGEASWIRGSFKYTWLGFISVLKMHAAAVRLTADDKPPRTVRIPGAIVLTATETFGGGYRVCPGATPVNDSGTLCIASGLSKLQLLRLMGPLKKGTHLGLWGTTLERWNRVQIDDVEDPAAAGRRGGGGAAPRPLLWVQTDGDVNLTTPAVLEYVPRQLTVRGAARIPNVDSDAGHAV